MRAERQPDQRGEGRNRRVPGGRVGRAAARHRVDQPAGIERRQHVGQRRDQERRHDERKPHRLAAPVRRR